MRISDWSSDVCSSDLPMLPSDRPLRMKRSNSGTGSGDDHSPFSHARYQPTEPDRASRTSGPEIGRASCRERVSVRVDLGGRRIIKKKKYKKKHRYPQ